MDEPRDPFGLAVSAIRLRLRSGRLVQGEQLMARDLARDLRLSATPVREALARLAGEGQIDDRRGAGYFVWRLDAVDLSELYDLQLAYLRLALSRRHEGATSVQDMPAQADDVAEIETHLRLLILRGRSAVLQDAHALLADRLAPARRVEAAVLADTAQEWTRLAEAQRRDDLESLRAWVETYVARRQRAAPELIGAMRSAAGSAPV